MSENKFDFDKHDDTDSEIIKFNSDPVTLIIEIEKFDQLTGEHGDFKIVVGTGITKKEKKSGLEPYKMSFALSASSLRTQFKNLSIDVGDSVLIKFTGWGEYKGRKFKSFFVKKL